DDQPVDAGDKTAGVLVEQNTGVRIGGDDVVQDLHAGRRAADLDAGESTCDRQGLDRNVVDACQVEDVLAAGQVAAVQHRGRPAGRTFDDERARCGARVRSGQDDIG